MEDAASLAPFPQPPAYLWTQFTDDNVARIAELRESAAAASAPLAAESVPPELAALQPPPPPATGRWRVFGQLYSLGDQLPTLEAQGVPWLGLSETGRDTGKDTGKDTEKDAHAGKVFELKKLSKSLLLNFLELIGVLASNPHDAADKLADLQTIFFNMHQHVNEWRPHQTREALIALLQAQLERTRNETRALQEVTDSVRQTLVGLAAGAPGGSQAQPARPVQLADPEKQRQREIWAAMDAVVT